MRVCQRQGWSLAFWRALDDHEKTEWLAWDYNQLEAMRELRKQLIDAKAVSGEAAVNLLGWTYG